MHASLAINGEPSLARRATLVSAAGNVFVDVLACPQQWAQEETEPSECCKTELANSPNWPIHMYCTIGLPNFSELANSYVN